QTDPRWDGLRNLLNN
ncbi:hypothetical protein C3F09_10355, partial [candidate division GN15 bacterium]